MAMSLPGTRPGPLFQRRPGSPSGSTMTRSYPSPTRAPTILTPNSPPRRFEA